MGRLIDVDSLILEQQSLEDVGQGIMEFYSKEQINNAETVEAIPKSNVYKAIQEMMKYEHDGFINISLARLDEILKKCGVSEDGN